MDIRVGSVIFHTGLVAKLAVPDARISTGPANPFGMTPGLGLTGTGVQLDGRPKLAMLKTAVIWLAGTGAPVPSTELFFSCAVNALPDVTSI